MKLSPFAPGFRRAALLCLLGGLLCSVLASYGLFRANQRQVQVALEETSGKIADAIAQRIMLYQYGLRGARGAVLAAGEHAVTREGFHRYSLTRDPAHEFPGARGFGFIRRVPATELADFLQHTRADGAADFTLKQLSRNEGERFVIEYIEPLPGNAAAQGLDIASESNRRAAAINAMDSGQVSLTGPITLVQAQGSASQSFLMLMPVYRSPSVPEGRLARRESLFGWTYAALRMSEVLDSLDLDAYHVSLSLSDVTDDGREESFYSSSERSSAEFDADYSLRLPLMGRQWRVAVGTTPVFIERLNLISPTLLALGGVLASLLLALLAGVMAVSRRQHRQIQRTRLQLGTLVEHSSDCIIGTSLEGRVIGWNRGAETLFGFSAEEAVGQPLQALILPDAEQPDERRMLERIASGETVVDQETRRLTRDGRLLEVSLSSAPLYDDAGRIVGASSTLRDITAQKAQSERMRALTSDLEQEVSRRTEALSERDRLLSVMLASTTEMGIYCTDSEGLIRLFNRGAERLLGYTAQEVVGQLSPTAFACRAEPGDDEPAGLLRRRDGHCVPVSLVEAPILDEQGRAEGTLTIVVDLSERQAYEQRLAQSLAMTRAILDTVADPVLSLDAAGCVESVNPAASRVFGYPSEEMLGRPLTWLLPGAASELESGPNTFLAEAQAGDTANWQLLGRRFDGRDFPARVCLGAMTGQGERRFVCVIGDVTEQERQRHELLEARDHLLLAADSAELGIWAWNLADQSLQVNERMFSLYPFAEELRQGGLCYEHWRQCLLEDDVAPTEAALQALIERDEPFVPTFRIQLPDGGIRYIKAGARVERDSQGNALRLTGINLDVTEQQELETHLRSARRQADEASAAKSSFLANMSHEIRTPMNAVLGMLQLLQRTRLDSLQREYVDKSRQAADALLGLLNDILDYSKIEAGKLQLDPHRFEFEDLLRQLGVILAGNQGEKPVEVMFDLDPALPASAIGDALRLKQVLVNLSGNALKFTLRGQVVVAVRCLERSEEQVRLRFSVRDSGIGIDIAQQQRIFESFTQAEASTRRRFGGTGLGLVICRRLVELMGGELRLESRLGEGSRFWFDLTLGCEEINQPLYEAAAAPLRLLVVDDNAVAADVLCRVALGMGWAVDSCESGLAALEMVEYGRRNQKPYDLVLMDWSMPGLDGLATARRLRVNNEEGKLPLVIMVSAFGREVLSAAWEENTPAFDSFLTKPITPQQLRECVEQVLAGEAGPPQAQPVSSQRLAGLHVLLVEDNALNRQVAHALLEGEGARVALAEGGELGVRKVLASLADPFDLVLMDMQMPDVDGLEATRRIRADGRFVGLPIVAMTANVSETDRRQCLAAGMDDHVGKPVDLERLVAKLLQWTSPPVDEPEAPMGAPGTAPREVADVLLEPRDTMLARFGGDVALISATLPSVGRDLESLLVTLEGACHAGQVLAASNCLHSIKGSAATGGAAALARRAGELEAGLRRGDPELIAGLPTAAWSRELRALLERSMTHLRRRFAEDSSAGPSKPSEAVAVDVRSLLLRLSAQLQSANLGAAETVRELGGYLPAAQGDTHVELLRLVSELDYAAALQLVRRLLSEYRAGDGLASGPRG